jgi:hypothetical protein
MLFFPILTMWWQILVTTTNMNFHENPSGVGHAAPMQMFGHTDRNDKLDSRFSQVVGHRA